MATPNSAGGSLADRITKPDPNPSNEDGRPASHASWADEVNSPSTDKPPASNDLEPSNNENTVAATEAKDSNISQVDGATEPFMGSQLQEPEYAVEVKLADLQADPNSPLYSIKSFDDLGL